MYFLYINLVYYFTRKCNYFFEVKIDINVVRIKIDDNSKKEYSMEISKLVKHLSKDLNILIVDDDIVMIEVYKNIFANNFKHCSVAKDGEEAYTLWKGNKHFYDLIVTDVKMPKMNGLELVKLIKEESISQAIIVVTSSTDYDVHQDISYFQVDAILPKPLNSEITFTLLNRVLRKIIDEKDLSLYLEQLEQYSEKTSSLQLKVNKIITALNENEDYPREQLINDLIDIKKPNEDAHVQTTKTVVKKKQYTKEQENDLRMDIHEDIMSVNELLLHCDDTVYDKVDNLIESIDVLTVNLDKLRETENLIFTRSELLPIIENLQEFSSVIDSMGFFNVITRAFNSLSLCLLKLEKDSLDSDEKNKIFVEMFLYLLKDIENWLGVLFIQKRAENVHYFDASFVSNCLNISAIFSLEESEEEGEIEFF